MKILTEHSGRNKHGQALARVQCDCGRIFEPLFNNVKRGRTKSCGHCSDPAPVTAQPTVIEIPPETASTLERGSVAYLNDEIKRRIASLISTENQIRFLDGETAQQDATNLDTIKKRKAAAAYAKDLQQEIAALQVQKDKAETAVVKSDKTQTEITRDRIAALRGGK